MKITQTQYSPLASTAVLYRTDWHHVLPDIEHSAAGDEIYSDQARPSARRAISAGPGSPRGATVTQEGKGVPGQMAQVR